LIFISKQQILDIITINLQMLRFQDAVMTYSEIIGSFNLTTIIQYVILPLCAIGYVAWYVQKYLFAGDKINEKHIFLGIIAIFSLIISLRGVQRHSQLEMFCYFLFILILFLLPFLVNKFSFTEKKVSSVLILCIFAIMVPYPLNLAHSDLSSPFFSYHTWAPNETRVISDEGNYSAISSFIIDNLEENQTFFDFSNSPMLYIFTHKRHIPYIIPNLYQTSEKIQSYTIEQLEQFRENGKLPIIIFKQPLSGWNNLDGVPNEVRSYRIA